MNDVVYNITSFMIMREPTVWRWSHARHHTDTLIVGRDPEIAAMRPPRLARILVNFLGLIDVPVAFKHMALHAAGRLSAAGLSPSTARRTTPTPRPTACAPTSRPISPTAW